MTHDIHLEQLNSRPLAVVRLRAAQHALSKVVPAACGTVWKFVRAQQIAGAGRHVAVYLDGQINLEVGVELETPLPEHQAEEHGEVVPSATPAGLVAWTTHIGPYGLLHQAHEAIQRWCTSHGQPLAGPSWEIYGHWQDAWNLDPSQIETEVYYLLDS